MDPVLLPPPYGGMNDRVPRVAIQFPQCESLVNFNITEGGVSVRSGDLELTRRTNPTADRNSVLIYFNDKLLIVGSTGGRLYIYDYLAGAIVYTSPLVAGPDPLGYFTFNNYLFIFATSAAYYYDGTTYGVAGYTPSRQRVGGAVFKARAYFIHHRLATYSYSDVNAISGTLAEVSLSSITETMSDLVIIAPISITDVVQSVNLLTFVFASGEVAFYSGTYPDATDWTLVGKAQISEPLSYNSTVTFQGDVLVLSEGGIYSLRELFTSGNKHGVNILYDADINKKWTQTVSEYFQSASTLGGYPDVYENAQNNIVSGVFDEVKNRIVILFRAMNIAETDNQVNAMFFIYDVPLQSWCIHERLLVSDADYTGYDFCDIVKYNTSTGSKLAVMMTNEFTMTVSIKEGRAESDPTNAFMDPAVITGADQAYDYEIISAPLAAGRNYIANAVGLDVILETDLYEETNYQFIKDLGAEETAAQTLPVGPTTSIQKPLVNMGIEGVYVQYKISGTTVEDKSVGLNIYGTNVWLANGSSPR